MLRHCVHPTPHTLCKLAVALTTGCTADTSALGGCWSAAEAAAALVCCMDLAAEGDKHIATSPLRAPLYALWGLWTSTVSGFAVTLLCSLSAASSPASKCIVTDVVKVHNSKNGLVCTQVALSKVKSSERRSWLARHKCVDDIHHL